jgi:hypothetical protein
MMTPEQVRAEALASATAVLAHPFLSGLFTTHQIEMAESFKLFVQQEITTEQLTVIAGRVTS